MTLRAILSGTGSALPRTRVSNAELATRVDTSDEWIVERTGIRFRHIAEPDETTATLGDRKSVGQGKSVSVRVDLGGRRIFKKKIEFTSTIAMYHTKDFSQLSITQ